MVFRPAEVVGSIHPDGHADAAGQSSLCFRPGGDYNDYKCCCAHFILRWYGQSIYRWTGGLLYAPSILQGSHDGPQLKGSRALLR